MDPQKLLFGMVQMAFQERDHPPPDDWQTVISTACPMDWHAWATHDGAISVPKQCARFLVFVATAPVPTRLELACQRRLLPHEFEVADAVRIAGYKVLLDAMGGGRDDLLAKGALSRAAEEAIRDVKPLLLEYLGLAGMSAESARNELARTLTDVSRGLARVALVASRVWASALNDTACAGPIYRESVASGLLRRSLDLDVPSVHIGEDKGLVYTHVETVTVSRSVDPEPACEAPKAVAADQQDEIRSLRRQLGEVEFQLSQSRAALQDMRAQARNSGESEHIARLTQRIRVLEQGTSAPSPAERPDARSWDDVFAFVRSECAGRLYLAKKAEKSAKESPFTDYALAQNALALLAFDYLDMKAGLEGAFERFTERATSLGVEVSLTGSAVTNMSTKDSYRVRYLGKTYAMGMHLAGSSSRDASRCFRIYFAMADDGTVVVGHLPTHLRSSLT